MFSRFLAAQNAAHHNQTLTVLPLHHSRRCFTSSSGPSSPTSSSVASKYWIFAWYSRQLERRPLLTKAVTSGILAGVGDIVCQYLSFSHTITHPADAAAVANSMTDSFWASVDWSRTAKFLGMGAFWVAPITHVWYHALSVRILPGSRTRTKVLQRLFVDQFIFAPLFVPTFLGGLWWLEGHSNAMILEKLWETTPSAVQANWTLWIPAQLVNFGWVPLRYQVLFGNVVALLWNVYVSWIAHYYGGESHGGGGGANDDALMAEHMVPPSTLASTPSP